ncbi:hypothetical protein KUTeg_019038, partial [Tegillarca granosa]
MWLNLEEIAPYVIDCFVDNMRLEYDRVTHTTHNVAGVDIKTSQFGHTKTVEYLDPSELSQTSYFGPIVDSLVAEGYVRNVSIRGAPYDFRKAPNELGEFYVKLKSLIEETYTLNNNSRVTLVGHSMGNPVTLYFLNHQTQAWKDKYIQRFITLAGVWGGVIKTLRLFASGDSLGLSLVVSPLKVRPEQRSMPSTAWLMPSDLFWNPDEILIQQPKRNYTLHGYYMRQDTENLIRDLTPPGVEVHCLHGNGLPTPGRLVYDVKSWFDYQPSVIPDDGDGTVNIRSLLGCLQWQKKQKQKVYHEIFKDAEHMKILDMPEIIAYIKHLQVSEAHCLYSID